MRYNPDTERGITIEKVADECRNAIKDLPPRVETHPKVWHAGQWVLNPNFTPLPA